MITTFLRRWLPVFFFAACHGNHIATRGRAVRHEYRAAFTTVSVICHPSGKITTCSPVTQYHPAQYIIHTHVGEQVTPIEVTQTQYSLLANDQDVLVDYETGACGGYSIQGSAFLRSIQ